MTKRSWAAACVFFLFFLLGCGDAGQQEVHFPLLARGASSARFEVDGFSVELTQARVGFGPVYFCATEAASSSLCPTAVAEFTATETVDALDTDEQELGSIDGVTGSVGSATFDYGITWFARQPEPTAAEGAPSNHSAHFEGRATAGETAFTFRADVDVVPQSQGLRAVQGYRTAARIEDSRLELVVTFDVRAWWRNVDFAALAAASSNGTVPVEPDARALNAVVLAMTATHPPTFEWRKR